MHRLEALVREETLPIQLEKRGCNNAPLFVRCISREHPHQQSAWPSSREAIVGLVVHTVLVAKNCFTFVRGVWKIHEVNYVRHLLSRSQRDLRWIRAAERPPQCHLLSRSRPYPRTSAQQLHRPLCAECLCMRNACAWRRASDLPSHKHWGILAGCQRKSSFSCRRYRSLTENQTRL